MAAFWVIPITSYDNQLESGSRPAFTTGERLNVQLPTSPTYRMLDRYDGFHGWFWEVFAHALRTLTLLKAKT